ncbi:hypothetical protein IQ268_16970 [Oculatella sp. LEGE 06141]|uniref:hypothetical protein n=1 Tax=Oculatella sp. LEGE 06141 TaxID=1828648 RepID=UPI00188260CB|nr:hypothetical protein [Oculatella sp. LEGE 06141]MBE9180257.1 hypothetical protein [Oculatella sp. LEGE 06141]
MKRTKLPPIFYQSDGEDIWLRELLPSLNPNFQPHILSCGAGFDSLALLIEYIENPDSRDFPLENLIVVHAVVGGESVETKLLMEQVIFPLCREHNIWFIQACRNGEREKDGITILSSTRQPTTFYVRGAYSLLTYLVMSGTVPQRNGSSRLCTLKFKGWVIDTIARYLFGDSPRQRYIGFNADETQRAKSDKSISNREPSPYYLIGYNADETKRLKDKSFGDIQQPYDYEIGFNADEAGRIKESRDRKQVFRFPLIEMGYGRAWCVSRVNEFANRRTHGRITQGRKSFCVNGCPFSECNGKRQRGNNTHGDLRDDWLSEPRYGGEAAFIEHISLAINDQQPLYTKQLVIDILKETDNQAAIAHYERLLAGEYWVDLVIPNLQRLVKDPKYLFPASAQKQIDGLLDDRTWAVYCVRRIFATDVSMPYRQTQILFQGNQTDTLVFLSELAEQYEKTPEMVELSYRFWTIERPQPYWTEVEVQTKTGKKRTKRIKVVPPRPYVEEYFVAAPAAVYDKQRITPELYDLKWLGITGQLPRIGINDEEATITTSSNRVKSRSSAATNRRRISVSSNPGISMS